MSEKNEGEPTDGRAVMLEIVKLIKGTGRGRVILPTDPEHRLNRKDATETDKSR